MGRKPRYNHILCQGDIRLAHLHIDVHKVCQKLRRHEWSMDSVEQVGHVSPGTRASKSAEDRSDLIVAVLRGDCLRGWKSVEQTAFAMPLLHL